MKWFLSISSVLGENEKKKKKKINLKFWYKNKIKHFITLPKNHWSSSTIRFLKKASFEQKVTKMC